MSEQTLRAVQIASLLVSTTCGTGFLIGSGELALHGEMTGCLYGMASVLGLIALAACARRLSITRQTIWARLDQIYGIPTGRTVALLSLVWMTGVLAAQIRGGEAILTLVGIDSTRAVLLIDVLLIILSRLTLSYLAAAFAICMVLCDILLVHILFLTKGFNIWLHAPVQLMKGLQNANLNNTGCIVISVLLMVVCGADYQQFVLAARSPAAARNGCLLAAGFVFLIGFLPASAVIATSTKWHLQRLADPAQVIPVVLMHALPEHSTVQYSIVILTALLAASLGAGYSILRAMNEATVYLFADSAGRSISASVLPLAFGTMVALHGRGVIDIMVDLNMVYVTAVSPILALTLLHRRISDSLANASLAIGAGIAIANYAASWVGLKNIVGANLLTTSFLPTILIGGILWYRSVALDRSVRI